MKYLISGSMKPFLQNGMLAGFIRDAKAKRIMVIALHHTVISEADNLQRIQAAVADETVQFDLVNYSNAAEVFSQDNIDYDGLIITGGLYDPFEEFMNKTRIREGLIKFISDPSKLFIGASIGFILLAHKLHTEMEADSIHLSQFVDNGLGLLPHNILLEVHYSEENVGNVLYDRIVQTLQAYDDLDIAYAFDGAACIKVTDFGKWEFKLLHGSYHVYR